MQQLMAMLLAFLYPDWDRWWWGANLKAIRPPFELHYHRWLIIALGCGTRTEPASALLYSAVWYDLCVHWCEFFGLFMMSLLCPSGQSEPRLWDRNVNNMGRESVMLITRKERTAREKNPVSFMRIFTDLLPSFIHSFILSTWMNLVLPSYDWTTWILHFFNTSNSSYWYFPLDWLNVNTGVVLVPVGIFMH